MKANLPKPILLSIGLIVKNEEKTLDKCLSSLQPLMKAVSSELIIADTGSTDTTKEIALRYTDQVFDFPWIDDFAAARNSTIDRARGEWYMTIDADEWFENTDELIRFFKEKKYKAYMGASYIIRNYADFDGKRYNDSMAVRAFRNDGTKFEGAIHESIRVKPPFCQLHDFAHHYGYALAPGEKPKKPGRNLPLLFKLLETCKPEHLPHTYFQICREYSVMGDLEQALHFTKKGLEALGDNVRDSMYYALKREMVQNYTTTARHEEALQEAKSYFATRIIVCATDIDIAYAMTYAYLNLGQGEECCESYAHYVDLCEKFDRHELNETDRVCSAVYTYQTYFRILLGGVVALQHAKLGHEKEALELLEWLFTVFEDEQQEIELFALERQIVEHLKCYDRYIERLGAFQEDSREFELLAQNMQILMLADQEAGKQIAEGFLARPELEGYCVDLFRLYAYRFDCDEDRLAQLDPILAHMLATAPARESYALLVYYALHRGMSFGSFVQRLDRDDLSGCFEKMAQMPDLAKVVTNFYLKAAESNDVFSVRWETSMLERIIVGASPNEPVIMQLFERYCRSLGRYVVNIYSPTLLQSDCIGVLPRAHQFGYQAWLANREKENGNIAGYLRYMEKAGERYPVVLPFVKEIVRNVKTTLDRENAIQEERNLLMVQIKEKIYAMIGQGNLDSANQILVEYTRINPQDPDITVMRTMLTAPAQPS